MEHYFDSALRFWNEFSSWTPTPIIFYTVFGMTTFSAYMMTRFAAVAPLISAPISFMLLGFVALLSNYWARGETMMGTTEIQKAFIFTTAGHILAGLILLLVFKANARR